MYSKSKSFFNIKVTLASLYTVLSTFQINASTHVCLNSMQCVQCTVNFVMWSLSSIGYPANCSNAPITTIQENQGHYIHYHRPLNHYFSSVSSFSCVFYGWKIYARNDGDDGESGVLYCASPVMYVW